MLSSLLMPMILCGSAMYASLRGVEVFPCFLQGVQKGGKIAIGLFPTLLGLLTAIYMLRASGCIDLIGGLLQPLFALMGIPQECVPLALLKPISGSGGLALGSEILQRYGADSYIGQVAAVMLGASETSIYTMGIYCGHVGLKADGKLISITLVGDLVVFLAAAFLVRCWMS